jgi:hypothetical protein
MSHIMYDKVEMMLFGGGTLNLPKTMARYALDDMGEFGDEYAHNLILNCCSLLDNQQSNDLNEALERIEKAQDELSQDQDQDQNGQGQDQDQDQNGQGQGQGQDQDQNGQDQDQDQNGQDQDQDQNGQGQDQDQDQNGQGQDQDQDQNGQGQDQDQGQNGQGSAQGKDTIFDETPLSQKAKAELKMRLALEALEELREDCLNVDQNMHHASLQATEELAPMLQNLGWKPTTNVFKLLRLIKSMNFKLGKGKPSLQRRRLDGIQPNEASHARALGCASEHIRIAQILEGRTCIETIHGGIYANLVIDTSTSMRGERLDNAKALLGSFYLGMTPSERHRCRVFEYNNTCREISMEKVPTLSARGGTDLSSLTPYLEAAQSKERWIVITDGDIPNMTSFKSEKLAIISLAINNSDDRVALYREHHVGDHANVERLFRRLLK